MLDIFSHYGDLDPLYIFKFHGDHDLLYIFIMEIMSTDEPIWEDHHHRSYFLPNSSSVDFDLESLINTDIVTNLQTPVLLQDIDSEENICNITKTTPIDISVKPELLSTSM